MDGIFFWLAVGGAALLVVALAVAAWEQLQRGAQPMPIEFHSAPPRAVPVDVEVDKLLELSSPPDDRRLRREALDRTLERIARPAAAESRTGWAETAPMVGPGPAIEPEAAQASSQTG